MTNSTLGRRMVAALAATIAVTSILLAPSRADAAAKPTVTSVPVGSGPTAGG